MIITTTEAPTKTRKGLNIAARGDDDDQEDQCIENCVGGDQRADDCCATTVAGAATQFGMLRPHGLRSVSQPLGIAGDPERPFAGTGRGPVRIVQSPFVFIRPAGSP